MASKLDTTATSTSADVVAKVIVANEQDIDIGLWDAGTKAREVLSDIQRKLHLYADEGRLILRGVELCSDAELKWQGGRPYQFKVVAGGVSLYEVCNTPLQEQYDAAQTHNSTGRVMAMQLPVAMNTEWTQQQVQFQSMLCRISPVYTQPNITGSTAASQFDLMLSLCNQALEPLNQIIARSKGYKAQWQLGSGYRNVISSTSSSSSSGGSSANFSSSDGMSCDSGRSMGSGSKRSSRAVSSGEVEVGNGPVAAAAAAAAGAAAAVAVAAGVAGSEGSLPTPEPVPALRVHTAPFSSELDVHKAGQAIRDHALAAYIRQHANDSEFGFLYRVQKASLNPALHLWAPASEWHKEQQQLRAAHVIGGGSTNNYSINSSSVFIKHIPKPGEKRKRTQQPSAAQESSLAASAADAATLLDDAMRVDNIVLVTVAVQPASVMRHAFGMKSQRDFVRAVAECSTKQQRNVFDLAHQCNASNKKALSVVSQAAGYAFFTGTIYFVISCYSVQWIGKLEEVKEVLGKDGNFSLQTTITLSEPIFGKDAGPGHPTARGAYLMLAELTLNRPYHHRQIARPDIEAADTATVAAQQQGGPLQGDDTCRDDNDQQQQQQQTQQPEPKQQQRNQQQQHQRKQQQQLGILQYISSTYQHFRYKDVQLHTLISDGSTAQVFEGTFNGQQVFVKTLSLDWDSPGTYLFEAVVYELLHDLQLAGVLPRLLAHGEYYGLRYCMIFSPAPGNRLSQLPQPYSIEVKQAVQAAAARIHAHGVIHGDLHEDNIFVQLAVGAAPKVTIIDLGHAHLASSNDAKQQEMADLQRMM